MFEGLTMESIDEVVPIMVMSNYRYSMSQHMHVNSYAQHCTYIRMFIHTYICTYTVVPLYSWSKYF